MRRLKPFVNHVIQETGSTSNGFTEPSSDKLLPDLPAELRVFTLVLDLSETLIYSDWKRERGWRTFKRPGVDAFLEHLAQFYEIVLYTDQLPVIVESVVERLDPKHCITYRLSRAATKYKDQKHYRENARAETKTARPFMETLRSEIAERDDNI